MIKTDFSDLEYQLDKLFGDCIKDKVFPGAALGFSYYKNNELNRKFYCYGSPDGSSRDVDNSTFYDLASLTKPLVTVLSLLALMEEKKIEWDSKLDSLLSYDVPDDKKNINIFHLMSHCSGLPAYKSYFDKLENIPFELRKDKIIKWILKENLESMPGEKNCYSDLGYILLGYIIEEKSGKSLDNYWKNKIIVPLSLEKKILFPKKEDKKNRIFASTGYYPNEKERYTVLVNDNNSQALGGITGHAGVFGTVEGVLFLCENILLEWLNMSVHPSYSNKELRLALKKVKGHQWTAGFDTPSEAGSSSGKFFSCCSVGHLGFTGTSFWIDLTKKIIIVFLTNRVLWDDKNERIKKIRPLVHDLVMEKLINIQHSTNSS